MYSTCSLRRQQNEAVVAHLLACFPDAAVLDPIGELGEPRYDQDGRPRRRHRRRGGDGRRCFVEEGEGAQQKQQQQEQGEEGEGEEEEEREGRWLPCRWGELPGTLVFEPRFGTSGLFVARILKKREGIGSGGGGGGGGDGEDGGGVGDGDGGQ